MTAWRHHAPPPPRPTRPDWPRRQPPATVQRASAEVTFAAHTRRPLTTSTILADELVSSPGGGFQTRSPQRHTLSPPTGPFNFVRIHGDAPRSRPLLVSPKLAHAQLAGGRPVVYAGTVNFDRGQMNWWSNYSGTYQPIAAFRAQADLPEDKFVPWQKLQMGGIAMQRGTFTERRTLAAPTLNPPSNHSRDANSATSAHNSDHNAAADAIAKHTNRPVQPKRGALR